MNEFFIKHEITHFITALPIALFLWWKYEASRPYGRGIFSQMLRRERNPSEAHPWRAKGDKNPRQIVFFFLAVFLIDIDHLVDYFSFVGLDFWQNPFAVPFFEESQKTIVPLHSWEIAVILLFVSLKYKKQINKFVSNEIMLAIAAGLLSHLLIDQFTYQTQIFSYSLIYRILNGFSHLSFHYIQLPM